MDFSLDISQKFKMVAGAVAFRARSIFDPKTLGGTYNLGNLMPWVGAALSIVLTTQGGVGVAHELADFFVGNKDALLSTIGTIAFFIGGIKYNQAYEGDSINKDKLREGHLWSAAGAFLIGLSLIGLSGNKVSARSAAIGMVLHAGGKLGSAFDPKHDKIYKVLPLLSRPCAVTSLGFGAAHIILPVSLILPFSLVAATLTWARADVMGMPDGTPGKRILERVFFVPKPQPAACPA